MLFRSFAVQLLAASAMAAPAGLVFSKILYPETEMPETQGTVRLSVEKNASNVIEAAATKPFGFMRFTPGPGVGGHCLPIDPTYLSWWVKEDLGRPFRFVELANEINDRMPGLTAETRYVPGCTTIPRPSSATLAPHFAASPDVSGSYKSRSFQASAVLVPNPFPSHIAAASRNVHVRVASTSSSGSGSDDAHPPSPRPFATVPTKRTRSAACRRKTLRI